jgi:hypothetical protein
VDSHAQLNVGMIAEDYRQLQRAANRSFGVVKKDQRHPIASRQPDQLILGLCATERRGVPNGFLQVVKELLLVVHRQGGVSHDVHEQDVRHLQAWNEVRRSVRRSVRHRRTPIYM